MLEENRPGRFKREDTESGGMGQNDFGLIAEVDLKGSNPFSRSVLVPTSVEAVTFQEQAGLSLNLYRNIETRAWFATLWLRRMPCPWRPSCPPPSKRTSSSLRDFASGME